MPIRAKEATDLSVISEFWPLPTSEVGRPSQPII